MRNPKIGQTSLGVLPTRERLASFSNTIAANEAFLAKAAQPSGLARLREYSITTVEEVIGIARVRPQLLANVLGTDVSSVRNIRLASLLESTGRSIVDEYPVFEGYRYGFGLRTGSVSSRARVSTVIEAAGATPQSQLSAECSLIDSHMPHIRDQGQRGTCVAFATCATVEYAFARAGRAAVDLSEEFQYWNCKQNDGDSSPGTWPEVSFPLVVRDGVCREDLMPYDASRDLATSPSWYAQGDASARKVTKAIRIANHQAVNVLKSYVQKGHLISIAVPVYDSWEESANVRITGNITLPLPGEQATAGHALVIVGFGDDSDFAGGGFFIVRNSWGAKWGTRCPFGTGYGTMPYRYIERHNQSAFVVTA